MIIFLKFCYYLFNFTRSRFARAKIDKPRFRSVTKSSSKEGKRIRKHDPWRLNGYRFTNEHPRATLQEWIPVEGARARTRVFCRNHRGTDVSTNRVEITPTRLIRRITRGTWLWNVRNRLDNRKKFYLLLQPPSTISSETVIRVPYFWNGVEMKFRSGNQNKNHAIFMHDEQTWIDRKILFFHPEFYSSTVILIASALFALHLIDPVHLFIFLTLSHRVTRMEHPLALVMEIIFRVLDRSIFICICQSSKCSKFSRINKIMTPN